MWPAPIATFLQQPQNLVDPRRLGVLVGHPEAYAADTYVGEQLAGVAGVFAADEGTCTQGLHGSGRHVAEVSDRGAHQHQPTGH